MKEGLGLYDNEGEVVDNEENREYIRRLLDDLDKTIAFIGNGGPERKKNGGDGQIGNALDGVVIEVVGYLKANEGENWKHMIRLAVIL